MLLLPYSFIYFHIKVDAGIDKEDVAIDHNRKIEKIKSVVLDFFGPSATYFQPTTLFWACHVVTVVITSQPLKNLAHGWPFFTLKFML